MIILGYSTIIQSVIIAGKDKILKPVVNVETNQIVKLVRIAGTDKSLDIS